MGISAHQFFQLLSDETRLRSLLLMKQEGELCVCELVYALEMSQPKISRHLASLRDSGVVVDRRQGQWIYYQISPLLPAWAQQALDAALLGCADKESFLHDSEALRDMPNRPSAIGCA